MYSGVACNRRAGCDVVLSSTGSIAAGPVLCCCRHLELCVHFCRAAHAKAAVSRPVGDGTALQDLRVSFVESILMSVVSLPCFKTKNSMTFNRVSSLGFEPRKPDYPGH